MHRRKFLLRLSASGALLSAGAFPVGAMAKPELQRLVILHTNDVHSRIEPFPMDGSRMQGLGGAAKRAALVGKLRRENEHVLLFDSGDIFQGTPYFNVFKGELEFKLMSEIRYDAATIGNHDFDAGIDGLHRQLPHAQFPFVICNYDFGDTILHDSTRDYVVMTRGDIRIGVFGVGIELKGLVPEALYGNTRYLDPVEHANRVAGILRHDEKCDLVVCLSHLGFKYGGQKVSDITLASSTEDVDLILGGHTHTFLDHPELILNAKGRPVMINQVGWAGVRMGRIDLEFERSTLNRCVSCHNLWIR